MNKLLGIIFGLSISISAYAQIQYEIGKVGNKSVVLLPLDTTNKIHQAAKNPNRDSEQLVTSLLCIHAVNLPQQKSFCDVFAEVNKDARTSAQTLLGKCQNTLTGTKPGGKLKSGKYLPELLHGAEEIQDAQDFRVLASTQLVFLILGGF